MGFFVLMGMIGIFFEAFLSFLVLAFIEIFELLFQNNLFLLTNFVPLADFGHVCPIPFLLFVELALNLI